MRRCVLRYLSNLLWHLTAPPATFLRPASAVSPRLPRLCKLLFSCVWEIYPDNVLTRTFTAGYDLRMDVACSLLLAWLGSCTAKFGGVKLRHIIVLLTAVPPCGTSGGHTQTKAFFSRDPEIRLLKGGFDLLYITPL